MQLRYARRLHNGDQVRIRETGEVVSILNAREERRDERDFVILQVVSKQDGLHELSHLQVA